MKNILIVQTAFLGDVILATPVLSELHRLYPEAKIDFLVKKGNESLLANNPKLHRIYTFDKSSGKWKNIFDLIRSFRKNKYDLIVNLHRFGSSGIITGLSGARKKYGFSKNPFSFLYSKSFEHIIGDGTHEVERNLSIIQEFDAKSLVRPELYPSDKDKEMVKRYTETEFFTIAPNSVWFTKQLPREKWIELVSKLPPDNPIYILGGPSDKEYCDSLLKDAGRTNMINLAGELSLLQSAALMSEAKMNYVNDSGPLHLASAMNAPVTVFFCSTVPDFGFGPLSDESEIREVKNLYCRPCGIHGFMECPEGHFRCGKEINL